MINPVGKTPRICESCGERVGRTDYYARESVNFRHEINDMAVTLANRSVTIAMLRAELDTVKHYRDTAQRKVARQARALRKYQEKGDE